MILDFFKKGISGATALESTRLRSLKIKPVVLLILDGFGIAPESAGNAISGSRTPNLNNFKINYPSASLIAAGEAVGLPANEAGNSEVGHLTIGSGRIVYQSLPKIDMSIKDGSFFENPAFLSALSHVRKNGSKLHLMGLVSSGSVHSSTNHLYALLEFCRKNNFNNVALHLFTDGRDAPPKDGINVISKIEGLLKDAGSAQIAMISGRYWAMDRDARWERTKKAYDAIVSGIGAQVALTSEAMDNNYKNGVSDEFIEPTVVYKDGKPVATVNDNDAVIFFNFRIDRPRQLTMAFVLPDFENLQSFKFSHDPYTHVYQKQTQSEVFSGTTFKRGRWPQNLFFVTMTEYKKN